MASKPWYTSRSLISAVKRKISFPISQNTFTEDDILAFANEELLISQVPSILQYHEEYFATYVDVPLESNKARYAMPDRSIGMKLRDIFYIDSNGDLLEMTRVSSEDRAYYDKSTGVNQSIHKFYVEGNEIVLTPGPSSIPPSGALRMVFFLRPNQLVLDERAATVTAFCSKVTIDNANIVAGDTVSIGGQTFTAVASSPSTDEFEIGATSVITATNLVAALNTNGVVSASNGSPSIATVTASHSSNTYVFITSNESAFIIPTTKCVEFDNIPENIFANVEIDFLQTKAGHKTYDYDIILPTGSVSGNEIEFAEGTVPSDFIVGDYICEAGECIIPQIPTDLHTMLAERTCARILSAIGDLEGLSSVNAKLGESEARQGTLIDNRVIGSPQKISGRHSFLRYSKMSISRRK